jgi:acyl carrier protein
VTESDVNKEDLRAVIAAALETEPEEVGDDSDLMEDLGVDSLVQLEISVQVEHRYGVPADDVIASGVRSLDELHAFLLARRGGLPAA